MKMRAEIDRLSQAGSTTQTQPGASAASKVVGGALPFDPLMSGALPFDQLMKMMGGDQSRAPTSSPVAPSGMAGLADQLRAQWGGDWNISGIDRAQELAGILQGKGVTTLAGLKIGGGRTYVDPSFDEDQIRNGNGMSREDARRGGYRVADTTDGKFLDFGDGLTIGNFSRPERDMFGSGGKDPGSTEFGYSTAGKGAVGFHANTGPNGQAQLSPAWNSSSEAGFWRDYAKTAATVAGGIMLAPAALGFGAAGAGGAAAGAGAFEGIGGAMASGGAPMTAAEFTAGLAGGGGAAAAGAGEAGAGFFEGIGGNMASGGAPMTAAEFSAAAGGTVTPTTFDALRAAEHANMGQAAGNVPATVNMGSLGGTTATSGGIQGSTDVASQMLRDATASGEVGGSALSQAGNTAAGAVKDVGSAASDYQTWVKGNPLLARGIAAGLGGLVGRLDGGGGGGGGGAPTFNGPPKAWNSGLQMGIQPGAYQPRMTTAPGPVRPSTGMRMSGASRYFGG